MTSSPFTLHSLTAKANPARLWWHTLDTHFPGCTTQGELHRSLSSTTNQAGQCRVQGNSQDSVKYKANGLVCWHQMSHSNMSWAPGKWELRMWIASVNMTSLWKGFEEKLKVESLVPGAEENLLKWRPKNPACPKSELALSAALRLLSVLNPSFSISVLGRHFRRDPPQCFALPMWSVSLQFVGTLNVL